MQFNYKRIFYWLCALLLGALLAGCAFSPGGDAVPTANPFDEGGPSITEPPLAMLPLASQIPTASPIPTVTPTPTPVPTATPTLHPMSILGMRQTPYPGSQIVIEETLEPGAMGPLRFEWGYIVNQQPNDQREAFSFSIGSTF